MKRFEILREGPNGGHLIYYECESKEEAIAHFRRDYGSAEIWVIHEVDWKVNPKWEKCVAQYRLDMLERFIDAETERYDLLEEFMNGYFEKIDPPSPAMVALGKRCALGRVALFLECGDPEGPAE